MLGLKHFAEYFPNYFNIPSHIAFLKWCISDYWFVPLFLFAAILGYIKLKEWKKLFVVLFFFFGYLMVVNITFPTYCAQFYYEAQYQPLAIMVAVPLVFDIFPLIKKQGVKKIFLASVLIICLFRIYNTHQFYTALYRRFLNQTENMANKKIILPPNYFSADTTLLTWGIPYENWLLSTIERKETRSIVMESEAGGFNNYINEKRKLISSFGLYNYEIFDKKYFIFNDTTPYQKISR